MSIEAIAVAAKLAHDHVVILEVLGAVDTLLLFVEEQSVARPLLLLVESVSSGLSLFTVVADNWLMDRCLVVFVDVVPGEVKDCFDATSYCQLLFDEYQDWNRDEKESSVTREKWTINHHGNGEIPAETGIEVAGVGLEWLLHRLPIVGPVEKPGFVEDFDEEPVWHIVKEVDNGDGPDAAEHKPDNEVAEAAGSESKLWTQGVETHPHE